MGKQWKQWLTLFGGAPKSLQMVIASLKLLGIPRVSFLIKQIKGDLSSLNTYFCPAEPMISWL